MLSLISLRSTRAELHGNETESEDAHFIHVHTRTKTVLRAISQRAKGVPFLSSPIVYITRARLSSAPATPVLTPSEDFSFCFSFCPHYSPVDLNSPIFIDLIYLGSKAIRSSEHRYYLGSYLTRGLSVGIEVENITEGFQTSLSSHSKTSLYMSLLTYAYVVLILSRYESSRCYLHSSFCLTVQFRSLTSN